MNKSPNKLYKAYAQFGLTIAISLTFAHFSDKEFKEFVEEEMRNIKSMKLSREDLDVIAHMSDEDLEDLGCTILLTKEGKRIAELPSHISCLVEADVVYDVGTIEITDEEFGKRNFSVTGILLEGEAAFE